MKRRLLCVFLLLILLAGLVSCSGDDVLVASSDAPYEGLLLYDGESEEAKDAALYLKDQLTERGLTSVRNVYTADLRSDEIEIIIGVSDREVSQSAMKRLEKLIEEFPDDLNWCYAYLNGKISIVASSADAYDIAIRSFFERYFDGSALRLPENLILGGTISRADFEGQFLLEEGENPSPSDLKESADLPYLGDEYDAGQGSSLYVMRDAEIWEYTKLRRSIETEGFVYYTGNVIGDNLFATYITETQILHTMFLPASGEIRTAVDKRGVGTDGFTLPALRCESSYETVAESGFTMVAIENSDWDWPGGLCMIFRLADGRFVIIDAGQNASSTRVSTAERIYEALAAYADDPDNIEVAAWLITHIHGDHYGGLLDLARGELRDKISIDTLIYNQSADTAGLLIDKGYMTEIIEGFDIKNVVKAHPGQEFFFADLTLTVYGSQDLIIEENASLDNVNEHSIVTMLDFSGKRILSLADAFPTINKKLAKIYKKELKADVLQTAHHGYTDTGAKNVNTYADPDIVLWSNSREAIEKYNLVDRDINSPFIGKTSYMLEGKNIDFDSSWKVIEP